MIKKHTPVHIRYKYLTNISPVNFTFKGNSGLLVNKKHKLKNKIYSKNLIMLLLVIHFNKAIRKKEHRFGKIRTLVLPKKQTKFTLLRAPYRYKVARIHLKYVRYFIVISFEIKMTVISDITKVSSLLNHISHLNALSNLYDTTFCRTHSARVSYPVIFKKNFQIDCFMIF